MGQGARNQGNGFRKLIVWQKGYELTLKIYSCSMQFPPDERFGITSQIRRAAYSVPANIAEGYERNHRKEYLQFLYIAKGSLGELETFILLSKDLHYLTDVLYQELENNRSEVARLLKGLIISLEDH